MIIKINNKKININGEEKTTKRTLTKEQVLREAVNGNLEFSDNSVYSSTTKASLKFLTSTTFESEGKTYTLKKPITEFQLLHIVNSGGFLELSSGDFFIVGSTGGGGSTGSTSGLTKIKEYQTKYVESAGTGKGTGGDTGIATTNTAIDLLSLFFIGNYKEYILKNRDNLEIACLLGDRRSFILPRRLEWTDYYSMNDLLTQTLIQTEIINIEYNFNATIDANLNVKITDSHTGNFNLFGATFAISVRHKL